MILFYICFVGFFWGEGTLSLDLEMLAYIFATKYSAQTDFFSFSPTLDGDPESKQSSLSGTEMQLLHLPSVII